MLLPETEDKEQSTRNKERTSRIQASQRTWIAYTLLLLIAFSFRFAVAVSLPNDTPEDGKVYAQMARNLLEQHVYSHAKAPPFQPSVIRLPGYSIFLAAIYSVCGHGNNTAVRIVQALLDTLTCALVAMVAYYWEPTEKRKRAASLVALALAAVCPFTTIYVATVLTETWASLFAILLCLLATKAFLTLSFKRSLWYWGAAGLVGGASVFFRPDSGLFVAGVGLTLVLSILIRQKSGCETESWRPRLFRTITQGVVLSIAFAVVLVPWTVRNWRQFHLFQPLAPTHGEMPGEFVPRGYQAWLRTWIDDRKYIEPMLWSLDESEIDIDELPAGAFDSPEEKARVVELINQYNDPPEQENSPQIDEPAASESATPLPVETPANAAAAHPGKQAPPPEVDQKTEGDSEEPQAEIPQAPEKEAPPELTPALDAAFDRIAQERRARHPLRQYAWLPLKRVRTLWFGPHADYYPFTGELFPLSELDHKTHQQIWLPLFEGLVWIYTLLGLAGGCVLWRSRDSATRRWLLLAIFMIFIRLAFFSTMENPEPRYTVEIFPFLAILGGIAIARFARVRQT